MSPTRTKTIPAAALACLLAAGCSGRTLVAPPLAPPIGPTGTDDLAEERYYEWVDESDVTEGSPVKEMVLMLGVAGREWREPAGPDGYVLRALLLDDEGRPSREEGRFEVFAVVHPAGPEPRPLAAWNITVEQADDRFRGGITPGYLLELDWGRPDPTPEGLTMVVVRWMDEDREYRITRNVVFEDMAGDVLRQSYPRP